MAAIYFADDEKEIRDIVTASLKNDGHQITAFETGDALLAEFKRNPCELVILDIMMPGTDGIGILTALRAISKVPIILLTAKDTDSDYYNGIALGSDDYIIKPFKLMLLSAKVHALLRRVQYEKDTPQTGSDLICGNLRYDGTRHEFYVGDRCLRLTPTERRFLGFMMEHFETTVSKDVLLDEIWDMNFDVESRAADETNRRLRKKLTDAGCDVYVQTVWGCGFKLTKKEAGR